MSGRRRLTSKFSKEGIEKLSQDKPVIYELLNSQDRILYAGAAKRGRVGPRLQEHLPRGKDPIPGAAKVRIRPQQNIESATRAEARLIKREQPPQNKRGK